MNILFNDTIYITYVSTYFQKVSNDGHQLCMLSDEHDNDTSLNPTLLSNSPNLMPLHSHHMLRIPLVPLPLA
jgi:hypothetical protein